MSQSFCKKCNTSEVGVYEGEGPFRTLLRVECPKCDRKPNPKTPAPPPTLHGAKMKHDAEQAKEKKAAQNRGMIGMGMNRKQRRANLAQHRRLKKGKK